MKVQLVLLQSDTLSTQAIHDAIAALTESNAYERSLRDSLWLRMTNWLVENLSALFRSVREFPGGEFIAYALLGTAAVLIIARIVLGNRATKVARKRRSYRNGAGVASTGVADAEKLAAQGDYTAAAHALYAATIDTLAARGSVRHHSSKTTGDFARELRMRNDPAFTAFQAFRRVYDHVIYGELTCSADSYSQLIEFAKTIQAFKSSNASSSNSGAPRVEDEDGERVAAA